MYDVIFKDNLQELIDEVKELVKDGWKPLGSITILTWQWENVLKGDIEQEWAYYQAMIKND